MRGGSEEAAELTGKTLQSAPPSALAIQRALNSSELSALAEGSLAAVACNAVWPRSRLFDAGLAPDDRCKRCGREKDTVFHRAWMCPHSAAVREQEATREQVARAREAGESSLLWARGWLPRPAAVSPPPAPLVMMLWEAGGAERELHTLEEVSGTMGK